MYLYFPFLTERTKSYFSSNLSAYPKVISCCSILLLSKFFPKKGVPSASLGISIPAKDKTVGTKSTKSTNAEVLDPILNGFKCFHFSGT